MSFYDVTHKYIQDKGLHRKGGYRGILSRKDLKSEISVAVFAATPPEVLKPIVKAKGISLILLEEIIQPELDDKYLSKINYTYLTTSYLLGSSQICVIIFAYVRLNAYWSGLLGLF